MNFNLLLSQGRCRKLKRPNVRNTFCPTGSPSAIPLSLYIYYIYVGLFCVYVICVLKMNCGGGGEDFSLIWFSISCYSARRCSAPWKFINAPTKLLSPGLLGTATHRSSICIWIARLARLARLLLRQFNTFSFCKGLLYLLSLSLSARLGDIFVRFLCASFSHFAFSMRVRLATASFTVRRHSNVVDAHPGKGCGRGEGNHSPRTESELQSCRVASQVAADRAGNLTMCGNCFKPFWPAAKWPAASPHLIHIRLHI